MPFKSLLGSEIPLNCTIEIMQIKARFMKKLLRSSKSEGLKIHFWEFLLPCRSSGGVKVGNYSSCGLYAVGYLLEEAGVLHVGYWDNKYPGEAKVKS